MSTLAARFNHHTFSDMQPNVSSPAATAPPDTATNPTPQPQKQFLNYIHNFRGIAIIFVVGGHAYLTLVWEKGTFSQKLFDCLWQHATVLFLFIAGYLFQHLSKKFAYKSYLKNKFLYVVLPYLIISVPQLIYRVGFNKYMAMTIKEHPDIYSWSVPHKIFYHLIHGAHLPQFWFIPMICIFYILAPVFLYIDKKPKLYYLLIPFIIVSLLVDREPFSDIPRMFVHFISVYMFGMFMSHYKARFLEFAKKYYILITALSIAALAANVIFYERFFNPLNYLHKMFFCAFFLYWLWRLNDYIPKFIGYLAEISFGIYFVHYYFNIVFYSLFNGTYLKKGTPWNWVICETFVIIGSILLIEAVKKILPKHHKMVIGC